MAKKEFMHPEPTPCPDMRCWPLASGHWPFREVRTGQWPGGKQPEAEPVLSNYAHRSLSRHETAPVLSRATPYAAGLRHGGRASCSRHTAVRACDQRVMRETADLLDLRVAACPLKLEGIAERPARRRRATASVANVKKHLRLSAR